jgi:hypothetical protein
MFHVGDLVLASIWLLTIKIEVIVFLLVRLVSKIG